MADYKELIRKAIQALPENNGAARRAVYEKARSALVGQLRALDPPLSAREITQHRLQLEDCIRQVEQEASEAVIAGLKQSEDFGSSGRGIASGAARPNGVTPAAAPVRAAPTPVRPAAVPAPTRPAVTAKPTPPAPTAPRIAAQGGQGATAVAAVQRTTPQGQLGHVAVLPHPAEKTERKKSDTIEDIIAAASGDAAVAERAANDAAEDDAGEDDVGNSSPVPRLDGHSAAGLRNGANGHGAAMVTALPPARGDGRQVPSAVAALVARATTTKSAQAAEALIDGAEAKSLDIANGAEHLAPRPQVGRAIIDPTFGQGSKAAALAGSTALSTVREVELEAPAEGDPQVAIERAIATLEREARNDGDEANSFESGTPAGRGRDKERRRATEGTFRDSADNEGVFARAPVEAERGGNALMIFLLVFLVLLVIAGGAGYWAWREGFIDFDAMFGKQATTVDQSTPVTAPATAPAAPPASTNDVPMATAPAPASPAPASPPPSAPASTGNAAANTEPAASAPAQSSEQMSAGPQQPVPLAPALQPGAPAVPPPAVAPATPTEPSAQNGAAPKSEERLSQSGGAAAPATADTNAPGVAAGGSQSLLLEASQDGTTGAVPFSGTVEWSKGTDEMGQPTLVGKANIPARNLGVNVLIRKNSDPTLPASHLMEINFTVNDSFIGGSISGLPGVLLKNEELVQGTPLVGASARVVGNSFLFALSSSQADEATNKDLLTSRKWIDLAIIYATGKKAIITLEKDDKAEALFNDVFAAWSKNSPSPAAAAAPAPAAAKAGG